MQCSVLLAFKHLCSVPGIMPVFYNVLGRSLCLDFGIDWVPDVCEAKKKPTSQSNSVRKDLKCVISTTLINWVYFAVESSKLSKIGLKEEIALIFPAVLERL